MPDQRKTRQSETAHRRSQTGGMLASLGAVSSDPEFSTGDHVSLELTPPVKSGHFVRELP